MNDQRFDTALELLQQGRSVDFSDVHFYLDKEKKLLEVRSVSGWQIENLTGQRALEEIARGEKTYDYLITNNKRFAEIVKSYKLRFSVIEDSGNGSAEICYLSDSKLVWR